MSTRRSARLGVKTAAPASAPNGAGSLSVARAPRPSETCRVIPSDGEDDMCHSDTEYEPSEEGAVHGPWLLRSQSTELRSNVESTEMSKRPESSTRTHSVFAGSEAQFARKPAARSRLQGRLKNIMSVPLDILFEVRHASPSCPLHSVLI